MRIRKHNSGSVATPALLSLVLIILVVVTVYVFAAGTYAPPKTITSGLKKFTMLPTAAPSAFAASSTI